MIAADDADPSDRSGRREALAAHPSKCDTAPVRIDRNAFLRDVSQAATIGSLPLMYTEVLGPFTWLNSVGPAARQYVTCYRVQGGTPPNASQTRVVVDAAGNSYITGTERLYLNVDQALRAVQFLQRNRSGANIVAFEVPADLVGRWGVTAVPQRFGRNSTVNGRLQFA